MNFQQKILDVLKGKDKKYLSDKQIFAIVGVNSRFEKDAVRQALQALVKDNELEYDKRNNRYRVLDRENLVEGTIEGNARGFAFLIRNDGQPDLFVAPPMLNGALHKDRVLVRPVANTEDEAEVVAILERGMPDVVGTLSKSNFTSFVIPDETKFCKDIYISKSNLNGASDGQKVVAHITEYPTERDKKPEGKIMQVLGYSGEHDADMLSVAYSFGIHKEFSPAVMRRAERLPFEVSQEDIEGRRDFRSDIVFTIDGDDAKDLDDAVSIVAHADGTYTLGVHIADVSHYVKPTDDIDKEAFARGTSVYFPEMVFPMLPTQLSNGVCSLYEGVDRLTLSCIMRIDAKGKVTEYEVVPSVIHSKHRMTYNNVQKILDGDEYLRKCYADIVKPLEDMQQLANILISKRDKRGNINFDSKEVHFVLDDKGEVTDIVPYERKFAHRLIEEFMIIANETVAEYAHSCSLPFVYRVHEKPDVEKTGVLYALMSNLGINFKQTATVHVSVLANALQQAEGKPYYNLVNDVMLRTMQKAKYSPVNIGHFGLASECYCHFTSPIRRYPDLTVHRIIKTLVQGKMTDKAMAAYTDMSSEVSTQCSKTERNADEAERKAVDVKKCRYAASNLLNGEFDGIISGVTERGFFVELANTVEGMVDINSLPWYGFEYDDKRFCLSNGSITFSLGDSVRVRIVNVNITACKIDMQLLTDDDSEQSDN